jgi:lipopolysaccharide/colanic/teichoic acid biosynthesis glycosyltransferase
MRREGAPETRESARPIPVVDERSLSRTAPRLEVHPRRRHETLDRIVNIALATAGLILAAPLIFVFTLLVRLNSPGPIFYRQARVGLDRRRGGRTLSHDEDSRRRNLGGRPFIIYKFRTMRMNAENDNGAVWATKGDQRVTSLGRIMRKYRVDEIPQLFNVIRGEMNIVGPRPERPSIFSRLSGDIDNYPLRQRARPGITGWAQINLAYDTSLDDVRQKVRYDLEYLERQGVTEDLWIMARTVPVMIFRKGGW